MAVIKKRAISGLWNITAVFSMLAKGQTTQARYRLPIANYRRWQGDIHDGFGQTAVPPCG